MTGLDPVYVATVSVPGYLPMTDEPAVFDTAREAWAWLAEERGRDQEQCELIPGDTSQFELEALSVGRARLAGQLLNGNQEGGDGPGAVYAPTPGYFGDHDLGLVYAVSRVEHADYPHYAGYLHDCPACLARCYCDGEHAQCVHEGEHYL
jgi:hypothetical protein